MLRRWLELLMVLAPTLVALSCRDQSSVEPTATEGSLSDSTPIPMVEASTAVHPIEPVAIAHHSAVDPAASNNHLALNLLNTATGVEETNVLFSPFSIWSTLAMAALASPLYPILVIV